MKRLSFLVALALAALAVPAVAQAQQARARAATDWTTRVEVTAEGGYRMGNPDASWKLVEFGAVSCSHCAEFEMEQGRAIRDLVRTGEVSFEYRPFVLFPSDPGLFLLLSCQAPGRFFDSLHQLAATHGEWFSRLEPQMTALYARLEREPYAQVLPAIVRATGLDQHFRRQGMTDRRIASCLADGARLERLGAVTRQGQALGVQGTPTFHLNGQLLDVADYAGVVAALRQP